MSGPDMQMRTLTLRSAKFSCRENDVCIFSGTDNCNFSLGNRLSVVKQQVVLRAGAPKRWGFKTGKCHSVAGGGA